MTRQEGRRPICYLAPEIPSLSATFVYEELLALERRGYSITPISVRHPVSLAKEQGELASRVLYLYDRPICSIVFPGLVALWAFGRAGVSALRMLIADVIDCGIFRVRCWKLLFQFFAAMKLAKVLRKENISHLHVHFADVPAQVAMYASAMSGVPFTVMAHANDIFQGGLLLREKAARAVKMLTISEFNRAYLKQQGVPADKLEVVRCGVSFDSPTVSPSFDQRTHYRIGTLGRFVEKKGIDVLIKALGALVQEPSYSVELAIGGDGPLRDELTDLVTTMGISDIVHFEGNLAHHQVSEWMRSLDVFVLACKQDINGDMDGIPVVLMEAMSQYIPVVATRLSGIPELVIHEQTGLLALPDNPGDLMLQIKRLLDSPQLRERLSKQGACHVKEEFGQDVNLDRLVTCFAGRHPCHEEIAHLEVPAIPTNAGEGQQEGLARHR
jgi:colanic acid/amylovoran biosynthesis glycosyltransferase